MSLLLTVFFIELVCHLVLTIGSKPINDLLWQLYCRTPFGTSKDFQDQVRLRREIVSMKRELAGISAQDDFARWAKLRRKHDKAMEEHDKKGMKSMHNLERMLIYLSCRGICLPILVRCQSYSLPLDVHTRPAVRSTVLAHQDTYLHLSSRLVSMAD
jgi:CHD5-like protein